MILDLIFLISGSIFSLIVCYLLFLALASIWPQKRISQEFLPTVKFAVVVPAHNETAVIRQTLIELNKINYPKELYDVFVIADNCEDNTAEISKQMGFKCYERHDALLTGKGHALEWIFERLLKDENHGAFVVIDADTIMDSEFLNVMNNKVMEGANAVQGYYDVLNPECSPMGSLSYLGFVVSRNLRYKGRTRLGWTTNLLGNGMCFTRNVIQKFGWCATSIVEDIEYEMILHLNNIRVVFEPDARIYAEIPETFKKAEVQRGRWDIGKFNVRNKYLFKLLREGIRRKDISYFDSALELLIPPFSLFVLLSIAGYFLFLVFNYDGFNLNALLWNFVIICLAIYTVSGLILAKARPRIYLNLFYAPYFILWRFWIIVRDIFKKKHRSWIKTDRK